MPKGKRDDELELDFSGGDERTFKGSDANPVDASTGEPLFDDLSPRFQRNLDAAVAAEGGRKSVRQVEADEPDPSDEDFEEDEEPSGDDPEDELEEDEQSEPAAEAAADDELDEDADEPRHGRKPSAIERRVARANRMVEETRAQLAELERREREREAKDKLAASEQEFSTFKAATSAKLAELKEKKVKAIDDGDTAAQVDLDDQITDLKAELESKRREHESAKAAVEETSKRRGASQITLTKVAQWKRRNPRYERDPVFAAAVNALDGELVRSGSNPESDDHYKEIDRRLRKTFPDYKAPGTKRPIQRRHPSQQVDREASPTQRRPAGDGRVVVSGNKIKISPAKLKRVKENMARFGLDPTSKRDIQDYILNNPGI